MRGRGTKNQKGSGPRRDYMTTLHDLLKDKRSTEREQRDPRVDLRGRYSPIGISAVVAAVRCQRTSEDHTPPKPADRRTRN